MQKYNIGLKLLAAEMDTKGTNSLENQRVMTHSCEHITDYYNNYGLGAYQLVNSYFSSPSTRERRKKRALS